MGSVRKESRQNPWAGVGGSSGCHTHLGARRRFGAGMPLFRARTGFMECVLGGIYPLTGVSTPPRAPLPGVVARGWFPTVGPVGPWLRAGTVVPGCPVGLSEGGHYLLLPRAPRAGPFATGAGRWSFRWCVHLFLSPGSSSPAGLGRQAGQEPGAGDDSRLVDGSYRAAPAPFGEQPGQQGVWPGRQAVGVQALTGSWIWSSLG